MVLQGCSSPWGRPRLQGGAPSTPIWVKDHHPSSLPQRSCASHKTPSPRTGLPRVPGTTIRFFLYCETGLLLHEQLLPEYFCLIHFGGSLTSVGRNLKCCACCEVDEAYRQILHLHGLSLSKAPPRSHLTQPDGSELLPGFTVTFCTPCMSRCH